MNRLIATALLFLCSFNPQAPQIDHPLDQWFAGYNEAYFNDTLPKDTVVRFIDFGPDHLTIGNSYCHEGRCWIHLSNKYQDSPMIYLETLLHEMCHIKTWDEPGDPHGPKWEACMHSLADQKAFDTLW